MVMTKNLRGAMKRSLARFETTPSKAATGRDSMLYTGSLMIIIILVEIAFGIMMMLSICASHLLISVRREQWRRTFLVQNKVILMVMMMIMIMIMIMMIMTVMMMMIYI